jgi:hypothetical protein
MGSLRARFLAALSLGLVVFGHARGASADEVLSRNIETKITETSVLNYHFDNRDNVRENDKYGEWLNRFNIQATSGRFTAALRIDSGVYFLKPNPNDIGRDAATAGGRGNDPDAIERATLNSGRDLSTRYVNVVYPSKMYLTYTQRGLEVTAGDFYAQLGRGLVLAMRKVDELGVDTTIRGGKAEYKGEIGDVRLGAMALAGLTNPLRIDEVSGRQLTTAEGGRSNYFPLMPHPHAVDPYLPIALPTFSPDLIVGGKLEGGTRHVMIGLHGMQVSRDTSLYGTPFLNGADQFPTRNVSRIQMVSASVNVPNIADHASLYIEAARQSLRDPLPAREGEPESGIPSSGAADKELLKRLDGGYAVYALVTAFTGPFTLSVEGKHYDRFFPLGANVSPQAPEFRNLQYNAPPTTEPIVNDTQYEFFNTCVTGARTRLDVRASEMVNVYGSVGRYATWGERSSACGQEAILVNGERTITGKADRIRNDVWDPLIGFELQLEDNRTHVYGSTGIRVDDKAELQDPEERGGTTYYREQWIRYDAVKKIVGPWSLQMAGFHRYRYRPLQSDTPWREGENYVSVIYSPKITAAFGYEYTTFAGDHKSYYNGLFQYRVTTDSVVRLFYGQTRPAIRCVSGLCRAFPAFEGVKLEVVIRI